MSPLPHPLAAHLSAALLCTLPLTAGCGGETLDPAPGLATPIAWPAPGDFVPGGSLAEQHPSALGRMSGWVTHIEGPLDERPDVGHRGAFGTGNGHVFGLIGSLLRREHGGQQSVTTPPLILPAGGELRFTL